MARPISALRQVRKKSVLRKVEYILSMGRRWEWGVSPRSQGGVLKCRTISKQCHKFPKQLSASGYALVRGAGALLTGFWISAKRIWSEYC